MMELLRHLADGGCTVVCTTHVMENVFLTDKLFIIAAGKLIFTGGAQEARDHFGVPKLTSLFDRIEERNATEWRADFRKARRRLRTARRTRTTQTPSQIARLNQAARVPAAGRRAARAVAPAVDDPQRGLEEFPHPLRPAAESSRCSSAG